LKSIQAKEWPNSSPNRQEGVGSFLHRGVKLTTLSRTAALKVGLKLTLAQERNCPALETAF